MSDPVKCPTCGNPLPGGGRAAVCPCCLLLAGISGDDLDPSSLDEGAAHSSYSGPREAPGTVIGRYKLLEEIGEGGFAIVYLAEQSAPVRRRVALKILKPGMDTREVVARFETERQTLALMDHPNIAQVYDGGCTDLWRPYFVMELVNGMPLTKYCDGAHLGVRQRLELMLDVLSAVQHAHQKGIIHRDLKPSNILISAQEGRPVVKVIDFGIAKALPTESTGRTAITGHGRLIGTPEYMSPEQASSQARDIDTRSDVYALGVVLYELLTGRTPHDAKVLRAAGQAEIQRMLREVDVSKPSARLSTPSMDRLKKATIDRVAWSHHSELLASRISFSHDGAWLAVATGNEYHFHRVGTWRKEFGIPCDLGADTGWLAWSPRKTVIAIEPLDYMLAIHDCRMFSLQTSPQFEHQRPLNFSPDGSQLITTDRQHRIHLWDLALVRDELKVLSLDFPKLPYLPPSTARVVEGVVFESK